MLYLSFDRVLLLVVPTTMSHLYTLVVLTPCRYIHVSRSRMCFAARSIARGRRPLQRMTSLSCPALASVAGKRPPLAIRQVAPYIAQKVC